MLTEEVVREAHEAPIRRDVQVSQGRGGGAKEEGGCVGTRMVALDDQGSRSCDMGSEVPKHLEVSGWIQVCLNVDWC